MIESPRLAVFVLIFVVAMSLAAAFAAGVYVGEHGPGQDLQAAQEAPALSYQPGLPSVNAGPQYVQPQPGGNIPPGVPPDPPNIVGRIRVMQLNNLELSTAEGKRTVYLTNETRYLDKDGSSIRIDDLRIGDRVGVYGRLIEQPERRFRAQLVVFLSP